MSRRLAFRDSYHLLFAATVVGLINYWRNKGKADFLVEITTEIAYQRIKAYFIDI